MERIVTQKDLCAIFNAIFGCCICWSNCPAFPGTKNEFPCLKKWFPRDLSSVYKGAFPGTFPSVSVKGVFPGTFPCVSVINK